MNSPTKHRRAIAVAIAAAVLFTLQVGCGTVPQAGPASAVPATVPGASSARSDSQIPAPKPAVLSRDFDFDI
jgi:hypothetical protein